MYIVLRRISRVPKSRCALCTLNERTIWTRTSRRRLQSPRAVSDAFSIIPFANCFIGRSGWKCFGKNFGTANVILRLARTTFLLVAFIRRERLYSESNLFTLRCYVYQSFRHVGERLPLTIVLRITRNYVDSCFRGTIRFVASTVRQTPATSSVFCFVFM